MPSAIQETTMTMPEADLQSRQFQIRFMSLFQEGRAMAFPCDEEGRVNLDELSERARCNYLFARAMVGREYATPSFCAV
jgi:hypothetical protein